MKWENEPESEEVNLGPSHESGLCGIDTVDADASPWKGRANQGMRFMESIEPEKDII